MAKRAAAPKAEKENIIPANQQDRLPVPSGSVAGARAETPGFNPVHRENLALWDRIFATDPAHTKGFKRGGGFAGTAIKPFWLMKRATQEFGPVGVGWGWEVVEEKMVSIAEPATQHDTGQRMWFTSVRVWYRRSPDAPAAYVGPQWGGTELVAKRAGGLFFDEEAPKKSVTDGITKCLSYLGFGGDVHMGLFDDSKYVADTGEAFREQDEKQRVAKASEEVAKWRDGVCEAIKLATTQRDLKVIWAGHKATFEEFSAEDADKTEKAAANYVASQFKRRKLEIGEEADASKDDAGVDQDADRSEAEDAQLDTKAHAEGRTMGKPNQRQAAE